MSPMKKFLPLIFVAWSLGLASAEEHPYKISPELDQAIQKGLHDLYNFEFESSLRTFESIKKHEVDHPMVAFGVASAHWWRVSTLVLETDAESSKELLVAINRCIEVSEKKIKNGDTTGEGHLVLGGALGLMGRWQAANREWTGAYFKGKKAYKHLVKALEINPGLLDANMGKGIFDYYIATLPALVRVLAFIGMGGDPEVGIEELAVAAEKGIYSRTPSSLFLADIYSDRKKPEKSIPILQKLRVEYPRSFFIHMVQIIALYNAPNVEALRFEAGIFQDKVAGKIYPEEAVTPGHFAMGVAHFKNREWVEAEKHFLNAAQSTDLKSPWRTWGQLYFGYVCDAQDRRDEATAAYKDVLKMSRRWTSHDNAKKYLKSPFKGTDEELKKLNL